MMLMEKLLAQKKAISESITNQINVINEISNQSNNLLLELEADRSKEGNMTILPDLKAYKYNKEIDQVLPKAIELFARSNDGSGSCMDQEMSQTGFSDFLYQNQQSNQYLSNNVRKAVVIADVLEKVTEGESQRETGFDEL